VTLRCLLAALLLSPSLFAAAPEEGVVELAEAAPAQDEAWAALLAKKGTPVWPGLLEAWLKKNPHGPLASLALVQEAEREDDLTKAAATLRLARGEGQGTEAGAAAAYELARLDYAQERPESALAGLEEAESWPRPEAQQPDWLYWKAQCRLVLKGYQRARDDFEHLAAGWPKHPRAPAALLGQAECDVALKAYDKAVPVLEQLSRPGSAFAAQALWALAGAKARQGDPAGARELYRRLRRDYPASFEAASVEEKLAALPQAAPTPMPTPAPSGRFSVQVGAFARKATADKLAARLRKKRYPVRVLVRRVDGRALYLVKAGPYKGRAAAEKQAQRLEQKEKLPQRIIEE
jgi:TolA-binding protein